MTTPRARTEWQRLSSAASLKDGIAGLVADFEVVPVQELKLSAALNVPTGWLVASVGNTPQQPVRAIVTGHRSRGGWQACEIIATFRFTGVPNANIGTAYAAQTLQDLGADAITARHIDASEAPGAWAVRSSGFLTAAGVRMWVQISNFVAGSQHRSSGRLLEHTVFIATQRRTELRSDIAELTDSVHGAFCASLNDPAE